MAMVWKRLSAGLHILVWAFALLCWVPDVSQGRAAAHHHEAGVADPMADSTITDVLTTNHRDMTFSIIWRTGVASTGRIMYVETPSLGQNDHRWP
jgi:hypothetical protein